MFGHSQRVVKSRGGAVVRRGDFVLGVPAHAEHSPYVARVEGLRNIHSGDELEEVVRAGTTEADILVRCRWLFRASELDFAVQEAAQQGLVAMESLPPPWGTSSRGVCTTAEEVFLTPYLDENPLDAFLCDSVEVLHLLWGEEEEEEAVEEEEEEDPAIHSLWPKSPAGSSRFVCRSWYEQPPDPRRPGAVIPQFSPLLWEDLCILPPSPRTLEVEDTTHSSSHSWWWRLACGLVADDDGIHRPRNGEAAVVPMRSRRPFRQPDRVLSMSEVHGAPPRVQDLSPLCPAHVNTVSSPTQWLF